MFSDDVKKCNKLPGKTLLLVVAAGLVFLCLVIAMTVVVKGQVQRVQERHAQKSLTQDAIADCIESKFGTGLNYCVRDARSANPLAQTVHDDAPRTVAVGPGSESDASAMSSVAATGFVPAALTAH